MTIIIIIKVIIIIIITMLLQGVARILKSLIWAFKASNIHIFLRLRYVQVHKMLR